MMIAHSSWEVSSRLAGLHLVSDVHRRLASFAFVSMIRGEDVWNRAICFGATVRYPQASWRRAQHVRLRSNGIKQ